jgi:hypothetical protein
LAPREKRLAQLAEARAKIEARAKERYELEKAEHAAKLAAGEAALSPIDSPCTDISPPITHELNMHPFS